MALPHVHSKHMELIVLIYPNKLPPLLTNNATAIHLLHTSEEANLLPAQWASFRRPEELERAGTAYARVATGSEFGVRNVAETDDALVFVLLCDFRVARHGLHRTNTVESLGHSASEKDEMIFLFKLQPQARRLFRTKPDNDPRHAGNLVPRQTLDFVDRECHILYFQIRPVNGLLRPEREIVCCPIHKHKRFAVAVDAFGLWVEGNVETKIHDGVV
jgi:hypothetical protein